MQIRPYKPADKNQLLEVTLRAWKPVFEKLQASMSPDIYEVFVPDWRKEQMRSLDLVCDSEAIQVIVAEIDAAIAGFSAIRFLPDDFIGEVYMIGVDPDFQRQGVGRTLMDASLDIIKKEGFSLAMVETGGDPGHESARKIYESMGFQHYPVARYLKRI